MVYCLINKDNVAGGKPHKEQNLGMMVPYLHL